MTLSNHYGYSSYTIFAQTDQRNTTNTTNTTSVLDNDSFSAIGQIASLVITVTNSDFNIMDAFKVILTGEWNLSVRNGTVTNLPEITTA
jgi:hypothetical protein